MLQVKNLNYEINGRQILSQVNFSMEKGDRLGVVGKNGSGKSTLMNLVSGDIKPSTGEVITNGALVGALPQSLKPWYDVSTRDFISEVTGVAAADKEFQASYEPYDSERYSRALTTYEQLRAGEFDTRIDEALDSVSLSSSIIDRPLHNLSGGEKQRVGLAALQMMAYDYILLDEPTNSLDMKGLDLLESIVERSKAGMIIVSHDRRFLKNTATRVIDVLGVKGAMLYEMGYDDFIEVRQHEKEAIQNQYDVYKEKKGAIDRVAAQKRQESHQTAQRKLVVTDAGKGARKQAKQAREAAANRLADESNKIAKRLDNLEQPEIPEDNIATLFNFHNEQSKASMLLRVDNLEVALPDRNEKIGPVSLYIHNGEKVVITGDNGAGKTTLLRAIMEAKQSTNKAVEFGVDAKDGKTVYIDQDQTVPDDTKNAYENVKLLAPHLENHDAINLLVRLNVAKEAIQSTPAADLSYGERLKILLASVIANKANLIVLDEPTNNLDIETIEALQRALVNFKGSIVMIDHDRDLAEALQPDTIVNL